jgi:NTP pyrophosphatase (non-canonical NTP hydrolase)
MGELGEYANFRKKFERGDISEAEFKVEAAKELADVQIYLDILAFQVGVDLGKATMEKWNATSKKLQIPLCISADDWHYISRWAKHDAEGS